MKHHDSAPTRDPFFLATCLSVVFACAGAATSGGEECEDDSCQQECAQEVCTLGQKICRSGGASVCELGSDGCAQWSAPIPCAEKLYCAFGGECVPEQDPQYDNYWLLGQLPEQTTVYLYAREAVDVTFSGTNPQPMTIQVPGDTFTSYTLDELGFVEEGVDWFFLEMKATGDLMVNFDRAVTLPTGQGVVSDLHGDRLHDKPPRELATTYDFSFARSGSGDDIYVIYAPEPATVVVNGYTNDAQSFTREIEVHGLYVSQSVGSEFGNRPVGYGLHVDSDMPVAVALFDEVPLYPDPWDGSGYFFGWPGETEPRDSYMFIQEDPSWRVAVFSPQGTDLEFADADGNVVGEARALGANASAVLTTAEIGFPAEMPTLVHITGNQPFVETDSVATATDIIEQGAYMGWNTSEAELQIYTSEDAEVIVYDGRSRAVRAEFSLNAGSIVLEDMVALGFPPDEPFLAVVQASVPVLQEIVLPYYVRQYPGYTGPQID